MMVKLEPCRSGGENPGVSPKTAPPATDLRLRLALQATRLLVFQMDRRLRYTWIANPTLGLDEAGIMGRTDAELLGEQQARSLTQFKRRVLRSGVPERQELWVERGAQRGCYDLVAEPLRDARGRVTGLLCAAADITERKLHEEAAAQAHAQLRTLAALRQMQIEGERQAIAQDLHDELGSTLTAALLRLQGLERRLPPQGELGAELRATAATLRQGLQRTREICARLHPPGLAELGLVAACRSWLADWAAATGVQAQGRWPRLAAEPPPTLCLDVYRALQELLSNVARHAQAGRVQVTLQHRSGVLRLTVADDGHGFSEDGPAGLGLSGLRERVGRHGGQMQMSTGPRGARLMLSFPWDPAAADPRA